MSSSGSRPEHLGAIIGRAFAALVSAAGLADAVRDYCAQAYGKCRRCDAPLGGPSPEQVCETCHVDWPLEKAGGETTGEA